MLEKNVSKYNSENKIIKVSLKNNEGIQEIYDELKKMYNLGKINIDSDVVITNVRHKNLLKSALKQAEEAEKSINSNMPIDIISINLKNVLEEIDKITGENVSEEIIKEIFSKFCLGK